MKKALSVILTVLLVFATLSVGVYATGVKCDYSKLTDDLIAIMDQASNTDLIPVQIWFEGIDIEQVETRSRRSIGLNENTKALMFINGSDTEQTREMIQAYETQKRALGSLMQKQSNESFVSCFENFVGDKFSTRVNYVSRYAPWFLCA